MNAQIKIDWETDGEEFERFVGRKPKDKEELSDFAELIKKGIDAQLDWSILCECAGDEMTWRDGNDS